MTTKAMAGQPASVPKASASAWRAVGKRAWKYRVLYVLLLPTLAYFIVFHYYPYYGLTMAFKQFSPAKGIWHSPWVGLKHFHRLFEGHDFFDVFRNTLLISLYKLIFGFPVPLAFALMLNEVRIAAYKRIVQTVTYFPHFLSWVVFGGIMLSFLTPGGPVPKMMALLGVDANNLLVSSEHFRSILVITGIIKEFGFGAIIYLAALAGIDPSLYEAARIDGANRMQQIRYVTLPGLKSIIVIVLILNLGGIMDAGFEQVFIMANPTVYDVSDIIDTYVYRVGLTNADFSLATAVGLFKGVIGFVLVFTGNFIIKKMGEPTIW